MSLCIRSVFVTAFILLLLIIPDNQVNAATVFVPAGGDLYSALGNANCGDTIVIEAGATFTVAGLERPFVLKSNSRCGTTAADWITVRSSNADSLPTSLRDLSPAQIAGLNLPRLITNNATPAMEAEAGAHHYRVIGLEIKNDSRGGTIVNNGLVFAGIRHGSSPPLTLATVPNFIEFDRVYVHSEEDGTDSQYATSLRGFWLGASNITVKNSRVAGFRAFYPGTTTAVSSQAFLIERGPGPYTIDNSFLEAWFATIFTGGGSQWVTNQATVAPGATLNQATLSNVNNLGIGDYIAFKVSGQAIPYQVARVTAINGNTVSYVPQAGLDGGNTGNPLLVPPQSPGDAVWNGDVPKNLTVRYNRFWKNSVVATAAAALGFYGKGHMEFKTAKDTLIEGNEFSGFGAGFTITSRNQPSEELAGSNPWATVRNVTFRSNVWRSDSPPRSGALIGIQLADNLATCVPGSNVVFENNLFQSLVTPIANIAGSEGVVFRHNTAVAGTTIWDTSMIFSYGVNPGFRFEDNIMFNGEYGLNCTLGSTSACYPGYVLRGNAIVDNRTPATKLNNGSLANVYPAGNFFPNTVGDVGFVGVSGLLWYLAPTSPYKGRATGGTDPGVDMNALLAALNGAGAPPPTPTPTPTPTATPTPTPAPTATPTPTPTPTPNPTPQPTPTLRIITISGDGTGPAVALNAAKDTPPSFDVETIGNFGPDKRTRVRIFANGVSGLAINSNPANDFVLNGVWMPNLAESVRVDAELRDGRRFALPVELAGSSWTLPGLDQVDLILVQELRGVGIVELTLVVGGQRSNIGTINVR